PGAVRAQIVCRGGFSGVPPGQVDRLDLDDASRSRCSLDVATPGNRGGPRNLQPAAACRTPDLLHGVCTFSPTISPYDLNGVDLVRRNRTSVLRIDNDAIDDHH